MSKIFLCQMKSRAEMERDISPDLLGWWHDILPGKTLKLKEATQADIDRSWIRSKAPKSPESYLVEVHDKGCLILKEAIKSFKEEI